MSFFVSSTIDIPAAREVPRHIAIIMDGNGRWARRRRLPRVAGHRRGVETVRSTIRCCVDAGVDYTYSPSAARTGDARQTGLVPDALFVRALENEVSKLHDNDIRLRVVGDLSSFGRG